MTMMMYVFRRNVANLKAKEGVHGEACPPNHHDDKVDSDQ